MSSNARFSENFKIIPTVYVENVKPVLNYLKKIQLSATPFVLKSLDLLPMAITK